MNRILHIARREWTELLRQHAMMGAVAFMYVTIAALAVAALLLIDFAHSNDVIRKQVIQNLTPFGFSGDDALVNIGGQIVLVADFLIFTQFLGITGVLAGHTMLHDRQCHTLPFLLLAPVRRVELLAGKVLGAVGIPWLLYIVVSGTAAVIVALIPIASDKADFLPPSPGWMAAFFIGGPLWALSLATVCAIISTLARDVRTAQQLVWFLMLFATTICGLMLVSLLPYGLAMQAFVAGLGATTLGAALFVGSQIVSRDLSR